MKLFMCAFLATFSVSSAFGQEMIVPFEEGYPPLSYTQEDGTFDGFNVAVALALAEEMGAEIALKPVSFFEIADGDWPKEWAFSVASMSRITTRGEIFFFVGPYVFDSVNLVGRVYDDGAQEPTIDGSRIGVCKSCSYRQFLEGAYFSDDTQGKPPYADIEIVDKFSSETRMLNDLSLEVDSPFEYVIVSRFFAEFSFINKGFPLKIVGNPLYVEPLWIVVPKTKPEMVAPVTEALDRLQDSGRLAKLSVIHLGADFTPHGI